MFTSHEKNSLSGKPRERVPGFHGLFAGGRCPNRVAFIIKIMTKIFAVKGFALVCIVAWSSFVSYAQEKAAPRFKAVAFDYFVIFDPNSVIPEVEKVFPGKRRRIHKDVALQTV